MAEARRRRKAVEMLEKQTPGTEITVRLESGGLARGSFQGLAGDQVLLDRGDHVETHDVSHVETIAMELSSQGPE